MVLSGGMLARGAAAVTFRLDEEAVLDRAVSSMVQRWGAGRLLERGRWSA